MVCSPTIVVFNLEAGVCVHCNISHVSAEGLREFSGVVSLSRFAEEKAGTI